MEATDGAGPFDDPAYFFEPWWPGLPVHVRVGSGRVEVDAHELIDVLAVFPDLAELGALVGARELLVEGTLLALDAQGRPDRRLLRERLSGATRSPARAALVATDLLERDARSVLRQPFTARRACLSDSLQPSDWCAVGRGIAGEGHTMAVAAAPLGFSALSAHRLDAPYRVGPAGDAWLHLPIAPAEHDEELPPFLAVFRALPLPA